MAGQNQDKLHITLHVYDDDMDVVINREEEVYYRSAAKLITMPMPRYIVGARPTIGLR